MSAYPTGGPPERHPIVVFGSINLDLVAHVRRFPAPGETVGDASFATHPGGKGANQALAAGLAGAKVSLVGCVGDDPFGELALASLRRSPVDLAQVRQVQEPTGVATILVDDAGRNCIAVAPGANARATAAMLGGIAPGTWLVLQGELPPGETLRAIDLGKRSGARVLLNLAPPIELSAPAIAAVDCLIVNEHEAATLASRLAMPEEPSRFARAWAAATRGTAVVTLGQHGALACAPGLALRQPSPPIEVVDTTGAGDAFVGCLAASLAGGTELAAALRFAVCGGSLACARRGAQPSYRGRDEVVALAAVLPAAAALGWF